MNWVLEGIVFYNVVNEEEEEIIEDKINWILEGWKMVINVSYFVFIVIFKNKILEIFGQFVFQFDGIVKYYFFYSYIMKQVIQEGFIFDVLKSYIFVESYYCLVKMVEDDFFFDVKKV